jgi:hypothetical protein
LPEGLLAQPFYGWVAIRDLEQRARLSGLISGFSRYHDAKAVVRSTLKRAFKIITREPTSAKSAGLVTLRESRLKTAIH